MVCWTIGCLTVVLRPDIGETNSLLCKTFCNIISLSKIPWQLRYHTGAPQPKEGLIMVMKKWKLLERSQVKVEEILADLPERKIGPP
jgi:hypothetical protein